MKGTETIDAIAKETGFSRDVVIRVTQAAMGEFEGGEDDE